MVLLASLVVPQPENKFPDAVTGFKKSDTGLHCEPSSFSSQLILEDSFQYYD
jgi:hypothetical protein